jgi:hypothetical protein
MPRLSLSDEPDAIGEAERALANRAHVRKLLRLRQPASAAAQSRLFAPARWADRLRWPRRPW